MRTAAWEGKSRLVRLMCGSGAWRRVWDGPLAKRLCFAFVGRALESEYRLAPMDSGPHVAGAQRASELWIGGMAIPWGRAGTLQRFGQIYRVGFAAFVLVTPPKTTSLCKPLRGNYPIAPLTG